jgi:hypothetical protein
MKYCLSLSIMIIYLFAMTMQGSCSDWPVYSKSAFRGRVVDAETHQPVEGAVAVVIYFKDALIGGPGGPRSYAFHARETLTDAKGDFLMPSYCSWLLFTKDGGVQFIFYKPGYAASYGPAHVHSFLLEEYFSTDEAGKEGELHVKEGRPVSYRGPLGIVGLKRVTSEKAMPPSGIPADYGSRELPLLYKAINQDRKNRGLSGKVR